MRYVALVLISAASMAASYFVGTQWAERHGEISQNLCLTDRAIVSTLEQSLGQTTLTDLKRFGISDERWELYRIRTINRINQFKEAAPCEVDVNIPPDILKGG